MDSKKITPRYLSPQQVEELYSIPVGSLGNLRCQKRGPKYFRCGRKVLYRVEDLEAWVMRNPVITIDSLPED
jgi:hypothetical protein